MGGGGRGGAMGREKVDHAAIIKERVSRYSWTPQGQARIKKEAAEKKEKKKKKSEETKRKEQARANRSLLTGYTSPNVNRRNLSGTSDGTTLGEDTSNQLS